MSDGLLRRAARLASRGPNGTGGHSAQSPRSASNESLKLNVASRKGLSFRTTHEAKGMF